MQKNAFHPYTLHPSYVWAESVLNNIPEKYGKTLEEWLEIASNSCMDDPKERTIWLKDTYGLGSMQARFLVEKTSGIGGPETYKPHELVKVQYSGKKEHLFPICRKLEEVAFNLGEDIKLSPMKTYIPIYRKNVIALIKPSTLKRVDLVLSLDKSTQETSRLIVYSAAKPGDRESHRIEIMSVDEIDKEVVHWLSVAYERDI
ncbi:DUF4287 domain-containing protein [bacterium]|nr:DUF4287 domain-containing protein [bacterium]